MNKKLVSKSRQSFLIATAIFLTTITGCSTPQYGKLYGVSNKTHSTATPADRDSEWWIVRHGNMLKRVSEGNLNLILVGNSITQGWEYNT